MRGVFAAGAVEAEEIEIKKIVLLPPSQNLDELRVRTPPESANITGIMNVKNYEANVTVLNPNANVMLNYKANAVTGGSWEILTKRNTARIQPNSRGQTWNAGEFVSALPTYETYVISGAVQGNQLTLQRGEKLANVNIANLALEQIVDSDSNTSVMFTFSKSGGGVDANATPELFTMNTGNLFLNAHANTTLKKRNGKFEFSNISLFDLSDVPNYFSKGHILKVTENADGLEYGLKIETSNATKSLTIGSNLGTVHNDHIGIGYIQDYQKPMSNTVLIGNSCGQNIEGMRNVGIGQECFSSNVSSVSSNNTCVGFNAMKNAKYSNNNVAVGIDAGKNSESNGSIWIGNYMGNNSTINKQVVIGNNNQCSLLYGTMGNSELDSLCNVNAKHIYLCSNSVY